MSDKINFGKKSNIDLSKIKGGLKKDSIKSEKLKLIFDKLDSDKNGILDDKEISYFRENFDANNDNYADKKEAQQFIQNLGITFSDNKGKTKQLNAEDVILFLQTAGDSPENLESVTSENNLVRMNYTDGIIKIIDTENNTLQVITTDENGNKITLTYQDIDETKPPLSKVVTKNLTEETYIPDGDNEVLQTKIENKGLPNQVTTNYSYDGEKVITTVSTPNETVTTESIQGKPQSIITTKNGKEVSKKEYIYTPENKGEQIPSYVMIQETNNDKQTQTTVLNVDNNGNYTDEDFISRSDGEITLSRADGYFIETKNNKVTVYEGSTVSDYDSGTLSRVSQSVQEGDKIYEVKYQDGRTVVYVQNSEMPENLAKLAQKINPEISIKDLTRDILSHNKYHKGASGPYFEAAQAVTIPGEFEANDSNIIQRKSPEEITNIYTQFKNNQLTKNLYGANFDEVTLDKNYGSWEAFAKTQLPAKATKEQINDMSLALQKINPGIALPKTGLKINVISKLISSQTLKDIESNGIPATEKNQEFYALINKLPEDIRKQVLFDFNNVKTQNEYYKNNPEYNKPAQNYQYSKSRYYNMDTEDYAAWLKAKVYDEYGINLYKDQPEIPACEGLSVHIDNKLKTPNSNIRPQDIQIPVERYLYGIGVDIQTPQGLETMKQILNLSPDEIKGLSKSYESNFSGKALQVTPENIAIAFRHKFYGYTAEEVQQQKKAKEVDEEFRYQESLKLFAGKVVSQAYNNLWEQTNNLSLGGMVVEGLCDLGNILTFNELDSMHSLRRAIRPAKDNADFLGEGHFAEKVYEKATGLKYNAKNVETLYKLIQQGADPESSEYQAALKNVVGHKMDSLTAYMGSFWNQLSYGIMDIATMIVGSEAMAGTKIVGGITGAVRSRATGLLGSTAGKYAAGMAAGTVSIGGYEAVAGTAETLMHHGLNGTLPNLNDVEYIANRAASGAGIGAFGGIFTPLVTGRVIKSVTKMTSKTSAATKVLSKVPTGSKISGTTLCAQIEASGGNIAAQAAGFLTEVAGFTGYETTLKAIAGELNITGDTPLEKIESALSSCWEEYVEQLKGLGSIKGVAKLIQMMQGGKLAMQSQIEQQLKSPELDNYIIEKTRIAEDDVYILKSKNNNQVITQSKNPEAIQKVMLTDLFLKTTVKDISIANEGKTISAEQISPEIVPAAKKLSPEQLKQQETELVTIDNPASVDFVTRLNRANSREEFIAIRDDIKNIPAGKEKQALAEEYTKAYRKWSSSSERPDIRMENKPDTKDAPQSLPIEIVELPESKQKFANDLISLKTTDGKAFFEDIHQILDLCKMSDEQIQTAYKRGLLKEYDTGSERNPNYRHFSVEDIKKLSSVSDEIWNKMESLELINEDKINRYREISELTEEQFNRIPQEVYPDSDLLAAVKLDDKSWNRYKNDFMRRDDFSIDDCNMEKVLKLDDENYNKFKELSQVKFADTDTRFQDFEILEFLDANLDEKAYTKVKDELSQIYNLASEKIIVISKLEDKAYNILKEHYLDPFGKGWNYIQINSRSDTSMCIKLAKELAANEYREINKADLNKIFMRLNHETFDIALILLRDKDNVISTSSISSLIFDLDSNPENYDKNAIMRLLTDKDICSNEILTPSLSAIVKTVNQENYNDVKLLLNTLLQDKYIVPDEILDIFENTNDFDPANTNNKVELALKLAKDPKFPNEMISVILNNEDFDYNEIVENIYNTEYYSVITNAKQLQEFMIEDLQKDMSKQDAVTTVYHKFYRMLENYEVVDALLKVKNDFNAKDIFDILSNTAPENTDYILQLLSNYKKMELLPNQIALLVSEADNISSKDLQRLNRIMGSEKVGALDINDLKIACKFVDLYGKQNINEIPISKKRDMLHSLVASNTDLFNISNELSKDFPLIPKSQEEYCSLLPSLVRSLGIETKELTPEQRITMFNDSMSKLSNSLSQINDSDFAGMKITQEYPKDKFILDVLDKVKSLPATERQKVYDYFGFELHHNKNNQTGFSITGYPVNLNNGKKLAQITNPRTQAVVESLRPNVIRFSENNKIKCSNPQVQQFLNEIVDALPELRTAIGKKQHSSQEFDVMQHSLKVMQKITQDPKFKTLNDSDKKVIMLASLMHDITKSEGRVDKIHADGSSFDTFFIAQKFNLSKEEEIKLHTLIKQHEWLEYVNTAKSEEELTKRLQSVAYDLQQGNLFDMAEIFTHADLRSVKADDSFHDTTEGNNRVSFDGTVRSFGESANVYAERIRKYAHELQKSQPLLPQTKIPRANRIEQAITHVNSDGSTNIKGVYKDKDGLVIIKFNEVQDWEALGFPQGSISRGITTEGIQGDNIDTGNIKFFVHGLDYPNQLAKFDAFSLVDSDALLSVSYAERPESKFRFFRPQGVLLDVNSKYIHGGGNTDSGSGCGKSIQNFKADYIFGGVRESDRLYVSQLIKENTGMTDEQYIKFVEENRDKQLQEIEPVELREQLIKAFATINSNTRKGNRAYNEMYISNPNEVMGVFAYSLDYSEKIANPVEFLNRTTTGQFETGYNGVGDKSVKERTEFLRQYALERGLPFIIFGD